MQGLILLLHVGRQDLGIVAPGIVTTACDTLTDDHPRIVVTEDTGILLIAFGIRGDLTVLIDILREGRIVEHHTVFALEVLLAGVEALGHHAVLGTNLCHRTPALALDEDLGLLALVGTNLTAIEVVGTEIPLTIPAMFLHSLNHRIDSLLHTLCFLGLAKFLAESDIVLASDDEETCNHETLSLRTLRDVLRGLETLVGIPREAVQVQTVVPVGATNER